MNSKELMNQIGTQGKDMIERVVKMRQSPEFLTYRLMEARALPDAGKIDNIDIENLRQLMAKQVISVEKRMSEMFSAIHMIPRKNESLNEKYYRTTAKSTALRSIENTAEVSRDPAELDAAAKMFLDQRSVIIKIAQNPHLGEDTIFKIANSAIYKNDSQVGRALAHNHNMTPKAARVIAENFGNNQFVMYSLADNVSKQARVGMDRENFAQVCKELTQLHPVDFPLAPAIRGVNDPDHLRNLYAQHSKRPMIERNFDHATFHAIAQNPDTPIDVIHRMSKEPPLVSVFGKDSAITHDTLNQRLSAAVREHQLPSGPAPDDAMRPM